MKKIILLFCIFVLLVLYGNAFADTLYLKNGTQHIGQIVQQDDEKVIFRIGDEEDGIVVTFFKDEVLRIEKAEISSFITLSTEEDKQLKIPEPIFTKKPLVTESIIDAQIEEQPKAKKDEQVETLLEDEAQTKNDKKVEMLEDLSKAVQLEDLSKVTQLESPPQITKGDLLSKEKEIIEELTALLDKEELDYFLQINSMVQDSMKKTLPLLTDPNALANNMDNFEEFIREISLEIEGIIKQLDNLQPPTLFVNFHESYLDNLTMTQDFLGDIAKGDILSSQSKIEKLRNMNIEIQEELTKILAEKKKSTPLEKVL